MIKYLLSYRSVIFWMGVHALLGLSALFSPYPLIAWFYLCLFTSLIQVLRPSTPPSVYSALMVYLVSFELLARMAQTSPYIPYEMGKYLLFLLLVIGIFKYRTFQWPALWMAFLLIPGVLIDLSGRVSFLDTVFNFLGPLNVALGILFFRGKRFSKSMFLNCITLMIYPMVGVLAHAIFRAPDLGDVEFELGANMITSGGFGSNQVSTGLGLASFLIFIFWINRWKLTGFRWLDTTLLVVFILQGLLTFSRGGMVTGFLGMFVILIFLRGAKSWQIKKYRLPRIGKYLIPAFILFGGVFYAVNSLTDGMLLLRYQGETAGTVAGTKVKSLNTITSGRFDIFIGDVELFLDHPVIGAGVGASRYLRERMNGVIAHVELSRLLAEHGILGLIYFLILIYYGLKLLKSNPNPALVGILCAFFAVGLITSFHAAMRTFISPLTIGFAMIYVRNIAPKKKKSTEEQVNQTLVKL